VAGKYPSAAVEGLDLSAIQPYYVPPNLKFIIDDIEEEWVYPLNSYDYIHCRHVAQTIKNKPQLLQRALRYVSLANEVFLPRNSMSDQDPETRRIFRVPRNPLLPGMRRWDHDRPLPGERLGRRAEQRHRQARRRQLRRFETGASDARRRVCQCRGNRPEAPARCLAQGQTAQTRGLVLASGDQRWFEEYLFSGVHEGFGVDYGGD